MSTNQVKHVWEKHYGREKAKLAYPDENLVRLLSAVPVQARKAALDFGCGSGRHLQLLHDFGFETVFGADLSETSVRMCRERFKFAQVATVPPTFELPLPTASLDVVVLWGVLHYNEAPARSAILTELTRVLKPGGQLFGTLRAVGESHLEQNQDLSGADFELFDQAGAEAVLGSSFEQLELGYMERSPVGQLDARVCHWMFRCTRP